MTIPTNNIDQVVAFLRTNQQEIMNKLDYLKIGPGDPTNTLVAQKGTLWIRTDSGANSSTTRVYVNKDGKKDWTHLNTGN